MKKLSIIVPVFNVETYIRTCLESIFMQGIPETDFEVIVVNDGTKDNSMRVIHDFTNSHQNIVILEQENQGLSAARNTGLAKASGQYILFVDSDDLLIKNSLAPLLDKAMEIGVDMLVAGYIKLTDHEIVSNVLRPQMYLGIEEKTGHELFLHDFNPQECYVWRTIYRKAFLDENKLHFIPGIYFEDVPFTTECYLKAKHCLRTTQQFYIYRQRPNSIVSSMSMQKLFDLNTITKHLWENKIWASSSKSLSHQWMNTIFATFSITIWYISHDKKLLAKRKEYISDLKNKIPDLKFTNGLKQRLVSFLFRLAPCTYIKLRSLRS